MRFQLAQENRSPQTPNPSFKSEQRNWISHSRISQHQSQTCGWFPSKEYASRCFLFKGMVFFQVLQYTQTLNLFVLYSESLRPPKQGPESKFPLSQTLCVYTTFITQCLETNLVIYQVSCSFTRYQTYCAKYVAIKYVNQTTISYKTYFHLPAFWPNPLPPPKKNVDLQLVFQLFVFPKLNPKKNIHLIAPIKQGFSPLEDAGKNFPPASPQPWLLESFANRLHRENFRSLVDGTKIRCRLGPVNSEVWKPSSHREGGGSGES